MKITSKQIVGVLSAAVTALMVADPYHILNKLPVVLVFVIGLCKALFDVFSESPNTKQAALAASEIEQIAEQVSQKLNPVAITSVASSGTIGATNKTTSS